MDIQEFWNRYLTEDPLEIFDLTCKFFSSKIPQFVFNNYNMSEVAIETVGKLVKAKDFSNLIKFIEILKKKQNKFYKKNFQYFDEFLVYYFCFTRVKFKIYEALFNFIDNPLHDYEISILVFRHLLFYQYTEFLDLAISNNFDTIFYANSLTEEDLEDIVQYRFFMLLGQAYKQNQQSFDKQSFLSNVEEIADYFDPDFISSIIMSVYQKKFNIAELNDLFNENKQVFNYTLQGHFLRNMHEKGFEFYLSGKLSNHLLNYLYNSRKYKEKNIDKYFKMELSTFEKHLAGFSPDFLIDNRSEIVFLIWGSVYFYEFLYDYKIISKEVFNNFIIISKALKTTVIKEFAEDLWKFDFVHSWKKPDCISNEEFSAENAIFKKSISVKNQIN